MRLWIEAGVWDSMDGEEERKWPCSGSKQPPDPVQTLKNSPGSLSLLYLSLGHQGARPAVVVTQAAASQSNAPLRHTGQSQGRCPSLSRASDCVSLKARSGHAWPACGRRGASRCDMWLGKQAQSQSRARGLTGAPGAGHSAGERPTR